MDTFILRQKAKTLEPCLRIGKNGLTEGIHGEVEKLLKKRGLIKIKILNNCQENKDEIIQKIIEKSNSALISDIGGIFTIFRRKM